MARPAVPARPGVTGTGAAAAPARTVTVTRTEGGLARAWAYIITFRRRSQRLDVTVTVTGTDFTDSEFFSDTVPGPSSGAAGRGLAPRESKLYPGDSETTVKLILLSLL